MADIGTNRSMFTARDLIAKSWPYTPDSGTPETKENQDDQELNYEKSWTKAARNLINLDVENPKTPRENAAVSALVKIHKEKHKDEENDYEYPNRDRDRGDYVKARGNMVAVVKVEVGEIIETMVLTNSARETGFWIKARILKIDTANKLMDLAVLNPAKHRVAEIAKCVPYKYVRKPV